MELTEDAFSCLVCIIFRVFIACLQPERRNPRDDYSLLVMESRPPSEIFIMAHNWAYNRPTMCSKRKSEAANLDESDAAPLADLLRVAVVCHLVKWGVLLHEPSSGREIGRDFSADYRMELIILQYHFKFESCRKVPHRGTDFHITDS